MSNHPCFRWSSFRGIAGASFPRITCVARAADIAQEVIVVDQCTDGHHLRAVEEVLSRGALLALEKNIGIAGWNAGFAVRAVVPSCTR